MYPVSNLIKINVSVSRAFPILCYTKTFYPFIMEKLIAYIYTALCNLEYNF